MAIRMLHNKVAVVPVKSVNKKIEYGFVLPEVQDNLGEVVYVPADVQGLKAGDKVYYGPHIEPIKMDGEDVKIMDFSNIYAVRE